MSRKNILRIGGAALVVAALVVWALMPAPISVDVATAKRRPFSQTVDEQAKTRIRDHYAVNAPLSGEIDRISLREGDSVAAGDVIARLHPALPALLDSRTELELRRRVEAARAARQAAEARVARGRVAMRLAELEVERSRKLAQSHLVPAAKLETDELTLAMTSQELESAKADAHVAQHDIDIAGAALTRAHEAGHAGGNTEWPLVAPIGGRVLRVQQKSAGTVSIGTPLLELGDAANLEVVIEMLTTEAPQVAAGTTVRLDNWGGPAPLSGRVRRVEPWGFTKVSALGVEEQRVNVLVDITSPRSAWLPLGEGYRLDAKIEVYRREQALLVPTGALFRSGERWLVFTVTPKERARATPVSIGHRNEQFAEVLAGLKAGDHVIVYPADTVHDGVRVRRQTPGD
jgi:HlyD family secretion protein